MIRHTQIKITNKNSFPNNVNFTSKSKKQQKQKAAHEDLHTHFFYPSKQIMSQVSHLNEDWDDVEASNDGTVVRLTSQDVQGSYSALNNFLHAHSISIGPDAA